jgi:hypothetical protein
VQLSRYTLAAGGVNIPGCKYWALSNALRWGPVIAESYCLRRVTLLKNNRKIATIYKG